MNWKLRCFHNMKVPSIGIDFLFEQNILSHILTVNILKINSFFCDSKQEAVENSTGMRDFIMKYSVNKICISILNCHPENKYKSKCS